MFTVSYIWNGCQLMTISTPSEAVARDVYTALRNYGCPARIWQHFNKAPIIVY